MKIEFFGGALTMGRKFVGTCPAGHPVEYTGFSKDIKRGDLLVPCTGCGGAHVMPKWDLPADDIKFPVTYATMSVVGIDPDGTIVVVPSEPEAAKAIEPGHKV